jgi:kumamolisin
VTRLSTLPAQRRKPYGPVGVLGVESTPFSKPFHGSDGNFTDTIASSPLEHIATRYRFPRELSGEGECIGILSFGGAISPSDLNLYFCQQNRTWPDIQFPVASCTNRPNLNSKYDREIALDIQVASTLAPGAKIVVYLASNDEAGWVDALTRAIHDQENQPSVLSISWGATEDSWSADAMQAATHLLRQAANLGITICAASGDDGCARDLHGNCRVTFPASSPYVLACGGTIIAADDREVVWNIRNKSASGGGISDRIPRPDWQPSLSSILTHGFPCRRNSGFDGRQIPDVSGPASSYSVYVGGRYQNGAGGTSAVAPLWSALIARLNQGLRSRGFGPVGYFHPRLYRNPPVQKTFCDVTSGHNDPFGRNGYEARRGWDACTGWGTPNGQLLLEALCS